MAEEQFVQMYVRDFATLAARAEAGGEVEVMVQKRVSDLRAHAQLMDQRKEAGHLAAVSERLLVESRRSHVQALRTADDPAAAARRREAFLVRVAELLAA